MRECFAYVRVSTVRQGERGVSLQEQRDAIQRFAVQNDLDVIQWFEERETAAKKGRAVFSKMLALLGEGRAIGVIIHKIDRSARNLRDWACLGDLLDEGVDIYFANESLDMRSRGGRLSADIQAVVASDYIRNLREETRKGFYGRLKQGLYPMPAPIGYRDNGGGEAKSLCPVMGPLIREAFRLYAKGDRSLDSLTDELYRMGLRSRTGGKVDKNGLSRILNNPFYEGRIRLKRTGETFSGAHEPLVDQALFACVQAVLTGKRVAQFQKHDFVFRRLLRCKRCGRSMVGERQKGIVYYRCHTKTCSKFCVREDAANEAMEQTLSALRFDDANLRLLVEEAQLERADWKTARTKATENARLNSKKIERRSERLTEAYLDGTITREEYATRKDSMETEKGEMQSYAEQLETETKVLADQFESFLELAKMAHFSYKSGDIAVKREIVKSTTSNRTVDGKNVQVELFPPFQELANLQKSGNGGPYRDRLRTFAGLLEKIAQMNQNVGTRLTRPIRTSQ
jgi:DNA invertase Pin-like site-specific DNA recombinase